MIQDCIDELIEYISTSGRENDVGMAKEAYFREGGDIFGDEESYDMRVGTFLEWYVLDRSLGGMTLIEEYIEKVTDADKKEYFESMRNSFRSVFEIRKVEKKGIKVINLKDNSKYLALCSDSTDIFKKGNLLETRLFPFNNECYLSRSYIIHPPEVRKFIVACLKDGVERNDLHFAINSLANMSLKWEKYRNYKVEDIYRN